ncbi:MAG: hypothetical protein JRJ45_08510 [Deltaproteobacteria bacterium]|jgi:hypothetical protein|nr:hypothetical protein [Deltaproteobacteria bacterium]
MGFEPTPSQGWEAFLREVIPKTVPFSVTIYKTKGAVKANVSNAEQALIRNL